MNRAIHESWDVCTVFCVNSLSHTDLRTHLPVPQLRLTVRNAAAEFLARELAGQGLRRTTDQVKDLQTTNAVRAIRAFPFAASHRQSLIGCNSGDKSVCNFEQTLDYGMGDIRALNTRSFPSPLFSLTQLRFFRGRFLRLRFAYCLPTIIQSFGWGCVH